MARCRGILHAGSMLALACLPAGGHTAQAPDPDARAPAPVAQAPDSSAPASTPGASANALFELPPGDAATAIAHLDAATRAHATPSDLGTPERVPGYARDAWSQPATWSSWSRLLATDVPRDADTHGQERDARSTQTTTPITEPERRARLALLALEQGRSGDAWSHLSATSADPTWTAAILPRFLPGTPAGSPAGTGGLAGALPDGVVLAPCLPPPTRDLELTGRVDRRAMSVRSVTVGAAVIAMRVSVENEGVLVELRHVSGGKARVSVLLPEPPDYAFGGEYVDWYAQDDMRVPHALEMVPGEEEHTIYGRFEKPRAAVFPSVLPEQVPAQIEAAGLWLVAPDDGGKALLEAAAQSIAKVLGFACGLRAPHGPPAWSGTAVDLTNRAERAVRLAGLVSAIERFVMVRDAPR